MLLMARWEIYLIVIVALFFSVSCSSGSSQDDKIKQNFNKLMETIHVGMDIDMAATALKEKGFVDINGILIEQKKLIDRLTTISKKQLKRIKNSESGTKNSTLYLNIMNETKNLLLFTVNLIKAQRDFLIFDNDQNSEPVEENMSQD